MEIVRVDGFSFSYTDEAGRKRAVLKDFSCTVEDGALCLLVGATGCGKTTLLRALKPELVPMGSMAGNVSVCGEPVVEDGAICAFDARRSAAEIGFVMQDPGMQIVCDTVIHELAFGLENLGTPPDEMRRRVAEVAHFFGIEPWAGAQCETLSGGQKQIVSLAAALALRPRLLLLDEPTAQLDPNASRQFLSLLARVNRELGVTVLMATHSPELAADYETCRIELGQIGVPVSRAQVEPGMRTRWEQRRSTLGIALPDAQGARGRHVAHRAGKGDDDTCVEVREAYFRYEKTAPWVLRGLSVRVRRGSVHAVVGGNGSGKSTLLSLMAGVLRPQRGRVVNASAGSQALLPQDPKALLVCDTVGEELAEWRERCGYGPADERAMLERIGLADAVTQHPYDLSGGQQQRLALGKLLLTGAQTLYLDEPTKGLDPASCADAVHILRALADKGRTVVLVTHDLDFAYLVADEVSMVFDGDMACTEDAESFFAENLVYRPSASAHLFGLV